MCVEIRKEDNLKEKKMLKIIRFNRGKFKLKAAAANKGDKQKTSPKTKRHHHHHHENQQNETGATSGEPTIDIKKEIAFSILNVGEVLAKTIDYYSLSSSESDELKELIKISEAQAAHERKLASPPLSSSAEPAPTAGVDDGATPLKVNVADKEEKIAVDKTGAASSSSALSSPTISTVSSAAHSTAGSGSISPAVAAQQTQDVMCKNDHVITNGVHNDLADIADHISHDSNHIEYVY